MSASEGTKIQKIAVYSFQKYDNHFLAPGLLERLGSPTPGEGDSEDRVKLLPFQLNVQTAELARNCEAVCLFVNDIADEAALTVLASLGVKLVLTRSAGFNHIDLVCCEKLGMKVMRVPQYSPHAVAEHAVGLLTSLVRRIPRAYNRVREHNFNLSGLEGFNIHGKVIGVLGTGKIGQITAKILSGFGPSRLLGYDLFPSPAMQESLGMEYVSVGELVAQCDIISLHLPLLPSTYHLINADTIQTMKKGVVIINTSRGGLIDASALEAGLKSGHIGGVGLDVYENEGSFFFNDCSDQILTDDVLSRLLTFHNVIITAHQAFLTHEALQTIAETTLANMASFAAGTESPNYCNVAAQDPAAAK
eukprot:CAMPEP_0181295716 /NCGR_PEP_ID=MMETSP1101-20121128/4299_1 /TAXON_ID=46948 /ORGANISM="Rhodomonas abbreviata, Strain Caron Lab Isolate" /LENGTH=361 /DNA_ID=CAMNT_0023400493 /DNA_START=62 /DNA_END=1147 /DNA_ORIENTATION=-